MIHLAHLSKSTSTWHQICVSQIFPRFSQREKQPSPPSPPSTLGQESRCASVSSALPLRGSAFLNDDDAFSLGTAVCLNTPPLQLQRHIKGRLPWLGAYKRTLTWMRGTDCTHAQQTFYNSSAATEQILHKLTYRETRGVWRIWPKIKPTITKTSKEPGR